MMTVDQIVNLNNSYGQNIDLVQYYEANVLQKDITTNLIFIYDCIAEFVRRTSVDPNHADYYRDCINHLKTLLIKGFVNRPIETDNSLAFDEFMDYVTSRVRDISTLGLNSIFQHMGGLMTNVIEANLLIPANTNDPSFGVMVNLHLNKELINGERHNNVNGVVNAKFDELVEFIFIYFLLEFFNISPVGINLVL